MSSITSHCPSLLSFPPHSFSSPSNFPLMPLFSSPSIQYLSLSLLSPFCSPPFSSLYLFFPYSSFPLVSSTFSFPLIYIFFFFYLSFLPFSPFFLSLLFSFLFFTFCPHLSLLSSPSSLLSQSQIPLLFSLSLSLFLFFCLAISHSLLYYHSLFLSFSLSLSLPFLQIYRQEYMNSKIEF